MNQLLSRSTNTPAKPLARWTLSLVSAALLGGCALQSYVTPGGCPSNSCMVPKEAPPKAPPPKLSYVVLIPSPDGTVGEVVVKGQGGERVLSQAGQAGTLDGRELLKVNDKTIRDDFGGAIAARPKIPVRYALNFASGTTLTAESEAMLAQIVAEAESRPVVDVSLIGHTDTLNSTEYNDKLGLKRANQVSEMLLAKGLKTNSLAIESQGERNLLVPTPDNTYEPRNRRVEISVR
jgi:outer membrane protein OmpA-like peptidoglycan-associated protein